MAPEKRPSPPLSGLAIVADLWLWGAILFYAPNYLGIVGTWRILFNVCGFLAITISFVGALLELSKIWKSEGLSYWGTSLAFLIPALLLHMAVRYYALLPLLESIARVSTLILAAIGGALVFQGVPYFFWQPAKEPTEQPSLAEAAEQKVARRRMNFEIAASIMIALLSLATAVVKLVLEIFPQLRSGQP